MVLPIAANGVDLILIGVKFSRYTGELMMSFCLMKPIKYLINRIQILLKRISIRKKLLCYVIFLSITPVLIVGSISGISFQKAVANKIVRYSLTELTQAAANIQFKLAEYEAISLQFFVNYEFITALENLTATGDDSPNFVLRKTVENCFHEYLNNNPDLFGIIFHQVAGKLTPIVVTKDAQSDLISLSESFKETSAYNDILKADGGIVWSATIKVNRRNLLILGRLLKRISTGEPLGILALIIEEDKIAQLANRSIYNDFNNSLDGIENYSLIINSNGEIISSPFKEDIGKSASQLIGDIGLRNSNFSGPESSTAQGSFFTTVNQQNSLVTYKTMGSKIKNAGKSSWYLVNVTPVSFLYKEWRVVTIAIIVSCVVFGILAAWVSFSVTKVIGQKQ